MVQKNTKQNEMERNKTLDHRLIYFRRWEKKNRKKKDKMGKSMLMPRDKVSSMHSKVKMLQPIPLNHNYSALDKLPIHRIVIRQPFFRFLWHYVIDIYSYSWLEKGTEIECLLLRTRHRNLARVRAQTS